jgi:hypothetical protein
MSRIFLFETTHHALWAEQIAQECGLGAQVVPAPEEAKSKCGLAIEALAEDQSALAAALAEAGVPFRLHPEEAD